MQFFTSQEPCKGRTLHEHALVRLNLATNVPRRPPWDKSFGRHPQGGLPNSTSTDRAGTPGASSGTLPPPLRSPLQKMYRWNRRGNLLPSQPTQQNPALRPDVGRTPPTFSGLHSFTAFGSRRNIPLLNRGVHQHSVKIASQTFAQFLGMAGGDYSVLHSPYVPDWKVRFLRVNGRSHWTKEAPLPASGRQSDCSSLPAPRRDPKPVLRSGIQHGNRRGRGSALENRTCLHGTRAKFQPFHPDRRKRAEKMGSVKWKKAGMPEAFPPHISANSAVLPDKAAFITGEKRLVFFAQQFLHSLPEYQWQFHFYNLPFRDCFFWL